MVFFCRTVQRLTLICDVRVSLIMFELFFLSRRRNAFIPLVLDCATVVERSFLLLLHCLERLLDKVG